MPSVHLKEPVKNKLDTIQDFLSKKTHRHVSHSEIVQDLVVKYGKIYAKNKK